jgi:hypothetical protein
MMMGEIEISDSELVEGKLTSTVSAPKNLRKYIYNPSFFAIYDVDIVPNKSILNIPAVATVLPLAWLTGSDIHVDELDSTFKESIDSLNGEYREMFTEAPFTTEIIADELVDNVIGDVDPSARTGLLFSGGVDSTYSLISNLDLNPRLIMYWGIERRPYPKYLRYWENVIKTYSEFARGKGLIFNPIKTNVLTVLHERRIEHDFHELLYNGALWKTLQHSLVLLPLTAPLSMGRFDRLLIAASHYPENPTVVSNRPTSQGLKTDEKTSWASLRVKHDGYIPRLKKIEAITDYLQHDDLMLRVCLNYKPETEKLNCATCEKCLRTILQLTVSGVDPNICGFEVDSSTFRKIKQFISRGLEGKERITSSYIENQKMIPDKIEHDLHGSKDFFEWYKEQDLIYSHGIDFGIYRDLYNMLPFTIAKCLDVLYSKIGIKLHGNPVLPPTRKQWKLTQEN